MASFTAIFLECAEQQLQLFANRIVDEMRAESIECIVRFRKGNPWLALHQVSSDGPRTASRLSRKHDTHTIYLDAQTVVDYHHYIHYVGGARRRELKRCLDSGGWLTAFGKPEPWERETFLGHLVQLLGELSDPKERGKIEAEIATYEENNIVLGNAVPFFQISHVGSALALPGFGPENTLDLKARKRWWTFELDLAR